jgi:transposase InsO family protein
LSKADRCSLWRWPREFHTAQRIVGSLSIGGSDWRRWRGKPVSIGAPAVPASDELKRAIEGLALQKPPLPIAALYRQVRTIAQQRCETVPSYSVVYDIVHKLPADLVTLAHEGSKAYSDAFELVHRREAERPNAIWQADHTPLDILLIRPDGEAAKPWLTTVIDDYSRAVAGYFLSFEDPSALHTSLALRQAIWRKEDPRWIVCGIPDVLYTDNGSDFTSQHLEQVGADLKIRLVFSIPGKPRGRGRIERFFSTVNEMFLCELDGYAPAGGGVRRKPALTLTEFDAKFRTFLLDVYHLRVPPQRSHEDLDHHRSRSERYDAPSAFGILTIQSRVHSLLFLLQSSPAVDSTARGRENCV